MTVHFSKPFTGGEYILSSLETLVSYTAEASGPADSSPVSTCLFPTALKWQPTPIFLPGKIPWMEKPGRLCDHPWGRKESDMPEQLHFLSFFVCLQVTLPHLASISPSVKWGQ